MTQEIEKKYRLTGEEFARLADDLRDLGAEFLGEVLEENLIYSSDGLESNNAVLRVRKTETRTMLTYKRFVPRADEIKSHIEHETEVSNPSELVTMLEELGYEMRLIYEKKRLSWKLRNSEVVLDELPFGFFMEIEGTPGSIREAEMILEAEGLQAEPETYPALTDRLGEAVGSLRIARF